MWRTTLVCAVACALGTTLGPSLVAAQSHHSHSSSHSAVSTSAGYVPMARYPLIYRYPPYPLLGGGYPGYGYGSGYGGGYYLPPVFLPADALYGPQAMLRFMGLGGSGVPVPLANPLPNPRPAPLGGGFGLLAPNAQVGGGGQPPVRVSNEEARARAGRFLQSGNEHFQKQQFNQALGLYRQAMTAAPDVAVNYFRQGMALVALGRYDQAAKILKKGLSIDADWPRSQFRLDDIYGDNRVVKAAHREALAQAATAQPDDSDLLFLLGVVLYFDGNPDRAKPFFQRAHDLGPADRAHVMAFLKWLPAAPVVKAVGVKL